MNSPQPITFYFYDKKKDLQMHKKTEYAVKETFVCDECEQTFNENGK